MKMTREERIEALERLLRKAPDIMSPQMVIEFAPFGKNKVYEILNNKELKSYRYKKTHIIAKVDFIEYLADHCYDESPRNYTIKDGGDEQ